MTVPAEGPVRAEARVSRRLAAPITIRSRPASSNLSEVLRLGLFPSSRNAGPLNASTVLALRTRTTYDPTPDFWHEEMTSALLVRSTKGSPSLNHWNVVALALCTVTSSETVLPAGTVWLGGDETMIGAAAADASRLHERKIRPTRPPSPSIARIYSVPAMALNVTRLANAPPLSSSETTLVS